MMVANYGKQPELSRGKRVMVELRNGRKPAESWPADASRWTLTGDDFDIINSDIVK